MHHTSTVEIDLDAIAHNIGVVRRLVGPDCAICPVVKADAYGLGAPRIARTLAHAGVQMLAVYTAEQAADLFRAAIDLPILLMMPFRGLDRSDELYRAFVRGRLHLVVHDQEHLSELAALSDRFGLVLPLHLEIDTGMSRGGVRPEHAGPILERIKAHPRLRLAGLFTHFASAESDLSATHQQNDRFEGVVESHRDLIPEDCLVHAANSCAMIRSAEFHRRMVRIGQAWCGFGVEWIGPGERMPGAEDLRPAVTWRSSVVQIKHIPAGSPVGYGSTWVAPRDSVVGLIPVGYADGYPWSLSSEHQHGAGAPVSIRLQTDVGPVRVEAPVIGRVNMDQITIDLTDLGGQGRGLADLVAVGTEVELITPDRRAANHLPRLAELARTHTYELLCRLSPRIRRAYRSPGATIEVDRDAVAAALGRSAERIEIKPPSTGRAVGA